MRSSLSILHDTSPPPPTPPPYPSRPPKKEPLPEMTAVVSQSIRRGPWRTTHHDFDFLVRVVFEASDVLLERAYILLQLVFLERMVQYGTPTVTTTVVRSWSSLAFLL